MKRMADGGIAKMQGGGLSRAQQNMLRQAQEYAASSGQNPATLQRLTAQHGDLYGAGQQKKARSQMAGNQPGRSAMRGIGPGMKKGGTVPKPRQGGIRGMQGLKGLKSGGAVKMQGGGLSRAQQNMLRQAQEYAASSGQNPAALRKLTAQHGDLWGASQQKKAKRQLAGSQPGRTSMRGIGPGMKKGGMAKQGANARLDESLGERRGKESKKSQSFKSRRNESRGARKKSKPQSAGVAKRGWGAAIR